MAPKRPAAAPRPSSSASASDDDEQEVDLASPSPNKTPNKTPNNPPLKPTNPSDDEEDDEEGSTDEGSESEPDHNPRPPSSQSLAQPRPPQPPPNPSGSGSTESDSDESQEPVPVHPTKAKKPPSPSKGPQKKKQKPSLEAPPEQKKHLFQRVWALDDEIAVLRWLGDFRAKNGSLPANDALAEFVRGNRGLDVSMVQITDKLRRLKKRYTANAAREVSTGQGPSKAHEGFLFDLSKKVWGSKTQSYGNAGAQSDESDSAESNGGLGARQNAKEENNNAQISGKLENGNPEIEKPKLPHPYFREAVEELANEHPHLTLIKRAFEYLDESKAKLMEEKLKKQTIIELKQHMRRMDLKKEVAKMMLDAITKADS